MTNKLFFFLFSFLIGFQGVFSQEKKSSPYKTQLWKDGAWITAGVGLNVLGFTLIQNKDYLTEAEVHALSKDDIWAIDRWAAGYNSPSADELSYIPFYGSFALPFGFLAGERERNNIGQIAVLYIETMATAGAFFTITAGAIQKSRPLVYDTALEMSERLDNDAQRSFIAGHTTATAAATFFTAKVFSDFHPDSKAIPYIWAGAATIPAFVGYLRIKGGKHFLTDNLAGYVVGAACGILIPQLHKRGNENLDVYPTANFNINGTGINTQGLSISYKF